MDEATGSHGVITRWQAVFIGVGAMVGAGIFALLGEAGAIARSAVWLSFLLSGLIAMLQGYSFARLGEKHASEAGLVGYLAAGYGKSSRMMSVSSWLAYFSTLIVLAMVAVSFGSYAAAVLSGGEMPATLTKAMATLVVFASTLLIGLGGTGAVAKAQSFVVRLVIVVLLGIAVVTMFTADWRLLAPSTYPPLRAVVGSIALTFFAFLGFGVVSFTAKDLKDERDLGPATYLALVVTTLLYVAIAVGVFGQLTPQQVATAGPTAIALAAKPVLGLAGYYIVAATALLSTAGAVNSTLYPAPNLLGYLGRERIFPPFFSAMAGRFQIGLVASSLAVLVFIWFFNLTAIASMGSAVALLIFLSIGIGHWRIRAETGASPWLLGLGNLTVVVTLVGFVATTLVNSPASLVALVVLALLAIVFDEAWRLVRDRRAPAPGGHPAHG